MSAVYNLEPPTKGKVVLRTTMGDIDIELWPKEAPRAVRNFVQLCLEGYYDNTPFHRIIKDFMVQGGDPTGTGDGGESIYGRPFGDEFHSRLRFSHRGLVACANKNIPDTNGSQFFITMDRADHLDRKSTIFGKVTGDTIYNVMRFNELETGEDDVPEHPPTLLRAEVLDVPFDDIRPRIDRATKEAAAAVERAKAEAEAKAKAKGSRNFRLISFGDEAEEEEAEAEEAGRGLKIRSAHDALEDEKLSKEAAVEIDLEKVRAAMREAKSTKGGTSAAGHEAASDAGKSFPDPMHDQVLGKRKAAAPADHPRPPMPPTQSPHQSSDEDDSDDDGRGKESMQGRATVAGLTRGTKHSAAAVVAPSKQLHVQDAELLSGWERKREEYKERKRLGGGREKDTLSKLKHFQSKLAASKPTAAPAPPTLAYQDAGDGKKDEGTHAGYDGKVRDDIDHKMDLPAAWRVDSYLDDPEGEDGLEPAGVEFLVAHKLEFAKGQRDGMARRDDVDDYTVHDPLLEAGKAKFNKAAARQKKKGTAWAGRSRD